MKIIKLVWSTLNILEGIFNPSIHSDLWYIEVEDNLIDLDENGNYFNHYKLVWTQYKQDIDAENNTIKLEKRKEINQERDKAFKAMTVTYLKDWIKYTIDAHEKARSELNGAVNNILVSKTMWLPDSTITWTTADDQDIEFTYDEIIQIAQLAVKEYAEIHKISRLKKKSL